jgi:hypothetical protein
VPLRGPEKDSERRANPVKGDRNGEPFRNGPDDRISLERGIGRLVLPNHRYGPADFGRQGRFGRDTMILLKVHTLENNQIVIQES